MLVRVDWLAIQRERERERERERHTHIHTERSNRSERHKTRQFA